MKTTAPTVAPRVWPTQTSGLLTGPWEQAFWFVVPGPVASKSNYRHDQTSRATWARMKAFADTVALAARAARPRGWVTGTPGTPVTQRPKVVAYVVARSLVDAGNLDKSVLDAVEGTPSRKGMPATAGVVMVSDAQVAMSTAMAVRTTTSPGAYISFARLAPDATGAQVATSLGALVACATELLDPTGALDP